MCKLVEEWNVTDRGIQEHRKVLCSQREETQPEGKLRYVQHDELDI